MAYVYRHIRLDKNEPFYIGIGTDDKYYRAYSKSRRNQIWKRIVGKTEYRVEIILDEVTLGEAYSKEIEFISIYGRIDLMTGTLSNLTNGGDGSNGSKRTKESRERISQSKIGVKNPMYGRDFSETHRKRLSESRIGGKHPRSRLVIDESTGIIYETINEASFAMCMKRRTLHAMLTGQNKNRTNLKFI